MDHTVLIRAERRQAPEPHYEEFLGMTTVIASPAMRRLIAITSRIGRTSSPVLITGESGTGKELIARAVHHYSARAGKPFIDVNCAALPEHLMESELFGYEKGAFSGAETMKPGLFEAAHAGTLFLDEIGELDSRMQAKLLRVLDGQAYFRLGGSRKVMVDVRIVAATNLSLDEAVATGKFRRDLFHRLDSFHLHLPPLRERVEDIAPLAKWFLRESPLTLSDDALRMLEEYSWPGNIRELRNSLNKAIMFASGSQLEPGDLPLPVILGVRESPEDEYSLDGLEEQTIRKVLAQTGGHQQKAADLLGISRRTLIRKLKMYRSPEHFGNKQSRHQAEKRIVA
ncbi:MAG TPA: sigma-54 dependent transcriptional regulator [Bryobacteraceae bacterium]|nr:sigma-54 dependent transcriptional regulator [Bryobacteraceae bacterium]